MDRILRYGNIVNDPLYNCSARTPELIENSLAEPSHAYGSACITLGVLHEILFILCVKVMLEPANFSYPAYKIMVALSICDMIGVAVNSIVFGSIYYYGLSFCESPNIIYIAGSIGGGAWLSGSQMSTILTINRLVDIKATQNKFLINTFNGKYTSIVICIPALIGIYYFVHEPSFLINPKDGLAYWDPQIYENASSQYYSSLSIFNDSIIVSFNSFLSVLLCFNLSKHMRENFGSVINRRRQAALYFQCLIMVSLCNIAGVTYLSNGFFEFPITFQKLAGVFYQLATSLPPYIYLILNRSIRHGILKMFATYPLKLSVSTTAMTTSSTLDKRKQRNEMSSTRKTSIFNSTIIPESRN